MWSATARRGPTATHTLHNEMWPVCFCACVCWAFFLLTIGRHVVSLCSVICVSLSVYTLKLYAPITACMQTPKHVSVCVPAEC